MVAKRATKAAQDAEGDARERACAVLQVSPTADAEIITQAYWHLARRYRAKASADRSARKRLDELNDAYRLLQPTPGGTNPLEEAGFTPPSAPPGPSFLEELFAWARKVVAQTSIRWQGRGPEIGILIFTTTLLAFLALGAGASAFWTVAAAALAILVIWSPWRRI